MPSEHEHEPVQFYGDGTRGTCTCGAELRKITVYGLQTWEPVGTGNPSLRRKEIERG